jgi:hypothetical protein
MISAAEWHETSTLLLITLFVITLAHLVPGISRRSEQLIALNCFGCWVGISMVMYNQVY